MNKIVFCMIAIAIGAVITFFANNQPSSRHHDEVSDGSKSIDVTYDNFEEFVSNENQLVLLSFWTPDCVPSVQHDTTMKELAREYGGILVVGSIDLSNYSRLGDRCGISRIPTLLYIQNGRIIKRTVGFQSRERVFEDVEEFFNNQTHTRRSSKDKIAMGDA